MAEVQCRVKPLSQEETHPLTVGERFVLSCEGPWPSMDLKTLELRLDEKDKYALKLFSFQMNGASTAELLVTSYTVGPHDLKAVQLTDAQNSVVLNGVNFNVQTLQDPKDPRKEPYPHLGPIVIYPWFFVVVMAVLVATLAAGGGLLFILRRRRQNMLKEIIGKTYQSAPLPEIHRELRALARRHLFLADPKAPPSPEAQLGDIAVLFNQLLRVFLTRMYLLPAHRLPTIKVVRELGAIWGEDSSVTRDLFQLLKELDLAVEQRDKVTTQDLAQLMRNLRAWIDRAPGVTEVDIDPGMKTSARGGR